MINAKELRAKYFDDTTPDQVIINQLDKIEKLIIQAAEQKQDFVMEIVPIKVKDKIKEELENEDYTVWSSPVGIVTDEEELKQKGLQYITITWDENLVFFDELN